MKSQPNMTTQTINRENLLYRPCVGITLFNDSGKVFVGERIDTPGAWQMPQGGVDPGETPEQTALRELQEEVGTNKAEIISIAPRTIKYDLPDRLIQSLWSGKYRGQEQTWVAARFTGQDSDINLSAFDPPEFTNWQWVDLPNTMNLIVPFKRDLYKEVIEMFKGIKIL
jgi:putative (di)nucleoside polyphosphate hydrolase